MRYTITLIFCLFVLTVFSQDTLRVAVYDKAPFAMEEKDGHLSGLMVELWKDISLELGMTSKYELVDIKTLLEGVNTGKYNIGLGAISVTPEREKLVDFTHAVNPSGTTIGVSKLKNRVGFLETWIPVFKSLLGLIFVLTVMLFVAATIVCLVERKHVKDKESGIKNIADGMWWWAVTMTTVGYGDKVPVTRVGKTLGILWIFISIIFFSLFTANASAKLANAEQYRVRIENIDDLHQVKVVTVANSSGEAFLKRERVDYTQVGTLKDAVSFVTEGHYDAVVYNAPVLKYYNRIKGENKLEISEDFLLKNNMAIALEPNSPLEEKINRILLQKISEAKWQTAVYKYIGE